MLQKKYLSQEDAIASYDYVDIANGLGFVSFYPTFSQNSAIKEYILDSEKLQAATATGILTGSYVYSFRTSSFSTPRLIKGDIYLSGYADYSANNLTLTAQIKKIINDTNLALGAVIGTDASEVTTTDAAYVLKKTFSALDARVYKVTGEAKTTSPYFNCYVKVEADFADGQTYILLEQNVITAAYTAYEIINPYPEKKVNTIRIYVKARGDAQIVYEKSTLVYEALGYSDVNVTSSIASPTFSADGGMLLKLPATQTQIMIGEKILLQVTLTAATGGFVADPTNLIHTKASLNLKIPFRIDL